MNPEEMVQSPSIKAEAASAVLGEGILLKTSYFRIM